MEIILVSNNVIENNLIYSNLKLDKNKIRLPLVNRMKDLAKDVSLLSIFNNANAIYSSLSPSAILFAKTLGKRINKPVYELETLNDAKLGNIHLQSIKDVYFMQEHDFNIKLTGGESLNEAGKRLDKEINHIVYLNNLNKVVIFTHQRLILGYLTCKCNYSYTLEDNLVLDFNENILYNDVKEDYFIYKLLFEDKNIINIEKVYF